MYVKMKFALQQSLSKKQTKRLTNENKALFKAGILPNLCFVTCLTWFIKYFSFQRLCNIHLVLRELIKCAQPLQCENPQSVYSISTHILSPEHNH